MGRTASTAPQALAVICALGLGASFAAFGSVGCRGVVGAPQKKDDGSGAGGGGGGGGGGGIGDPPPNVFLAVPAARLTTTQYNNTLRALFPGLSIPTQTLPRAVVVGGFDNNARAQAPSADLIEQLANGANAVATLAVADPTKILPCKVSSAADEEPCGFSFVDAFGAKAYRRPLETDERDRLRTFFSASRASYGFGVALRMTIETVLQSPQFLYLYELGELQADGRYQLRPFELASRMSYFLWNAPPDDALLASAASGKLGDSAEIEKQARRLLADPRAHEAIAAFHAQWLPLGILESAQKDVSIFAYWDNAKTPGALRAATAQYVDWLFWEQGTLTAMLTDTHGFVTDATAPMFGVAPPGSASPKLTSLESTQRAGLLTDPGVMAALAHQTDDSPVLRGVFVLRNVLCAPPPPPPPGVNQSPPSHGATPHTTRDRFASTHEQGTCADCHKLIDGVGFGFEHYDATGAFRTKDSGFPVDSTGELLGTDVDGPFDGAVDLGKKLASSQQVQTCVSREWLRYSLGLAGNEISASMVAPVSKTFGDHGLDVRELLIAVIESEPFRLRLRTP